MKKEFLQRVINEQWVDTSNYRYVSEIAEKDGEQVQQIKRIERKYLETTAALNYKSDTNPNGWVIVYQSK
jgi:hypothetical protein